MNQMIMGRNAIAGLDTFVMGGSKVLNLDQLIKPLFANGEQGFFYDPNDLATMFQDAAGTVPVTSVGQSVGLRLDKSKGVALGSEIITNSWTPNAATITQSGNVITFLNASQSGDYADNTGSITKGKWYKVSFTISDFVSGGVSFSTGLVSQGTAAGSGNGAYSFIFQATATGILQLRARFSTTSLKVRNISVKELKGNHAYQTNSSMRPLLVASPQRLDYDIADDKLITTLPAQLTGCTVVRAVPNVGTQILTNQTIPTPYNDNTDHCGLIVINRALTATETSQITKLFNKAAGATLSV